MRLVFVRPGEPLPIADLVILPGSKATIADLKFFREQGWDIDLLAHARRGGRVLGICGGYQMLGKSVSDPHGMEGPPGEVEGLGLLDVATVLTGEKTLRAGRRRVPREWRAVPGLRDACRRDDRPGLRAAALALRRRAARRRDLDRRPDRGRLCAWAVRRRPPARGVARGARNDQPGSTTRRRSSARSTRSPTIARRISIATRCLRPPARVHWDAARSA